MNIGRFFRLNQSLSVVVDGVVVYDYTGLPAYQGLASDNTMSPKYPISLVITPDSVRFRMHYCAYKTKWNDAHGNDHYDYQYAVKDVFKTGADNNIAHVNEVILELPFVEKPTSDLTDIVKGTYIANFPQVSADKHGRALTKMGHILKNVGDELQRMGADIYVAYGNISELKHIQDAVATLQRMEDELREKSDAFLVCARDLQQINENLTQLSEAIKNSEVKNTISFLNKKAIALKESCGVLRDVVAFFKKHKRNVQNWNSRINELPRVHNNLKENGKALRQKGRSLLKVGQDVLESSESQMTGSRFLDKLIKEWSDGVGSKPSAVSYSTLWLMDLYKGNGFDLYDDTSKGSEQVTKFLRKLLLDFMFDLKHSTVFCTSPNYDRMYNGLMSNYYFSALMHKCEFYYYRELTIRAVDENLVKKTDDQLVLLYAKELFNAEELWAADIRNPLSDKYFEQTFPDDFRQRERKLLKDNVKEVLNCIRYSDLKLFSKEFYLPFHKDTRWNELKSFSRDLHLRLSSNTQWKNLKLSCKKLFGGLIKGRQWTELRSNVFERMTRTRWDSWFANPEEEMRRIYFVMRENGIKRICNSSVLVEHLGMDKSEDDTVKAMALSARQNRGNSSRWFLNRYDFNDVLHLHLFKWANFLWLAILCVFLFFLFELKDIPFIKDGPAKGLWGILNFADKVREWLLVNHLCTTVVVLLIVLFGDILFIKWGNFYPGKNNPLRRSFRRFRAKRVILITWAIACLMLLPYNLLHADNLEGCGYDDWLYAFLIISGCSAFAFVLIRDIYVRICIIVLSILFCSCHDLLTISVWTKGVKVLAGLLIAAGAYLGLDSLIFSKKCKELRKPYVHPIESWHLMLPKLIASITAAWLTIAMGFDALAAFFDSPVVWSTMSIIIIVVFSFILYQIDRELPESSSWMKVYRSFELLIISYCLSLCIGVIIINFVGVRYLERSGALDVYYDEYVYEHGKAPLIVEVNHVDTLIDADSLKSEREKFKLLSQDYTKCRLILDKVLLFPLPEEMKNEGLQKQDYKDFLQTIGAVLFFSPSSESHGQMVALDDKKYTGFLLAQDSLPSPTTSYVHRYRLAKKEPVYARKKIIYSKGDLFIVQDFLVMFSFVAMFIGVFLQMVFFDRKKMTEF